jgi:hypothetical protein
VDRAWKTSAEKVQGRMVASGENFNAASWLNEPGSPCIAIWMGFRIAVLEMGVSNF